MTEKEKSEISTLAVDLSRKQLVFQAHAMANLPTDPAERGRAIAAYYIAQTELAEAQENMARAQARVATRACSECGKYPCECDDC